VGIIATYTEQGRDGGTWYVAAYPLGGTRYYRTEEARAVAVDAYAAAIMATGGRVVVT